MLKKFIPTNAAQFMRDGAILLTVGNTILAVGANVAANAPHWLSVTWPVLYGVAGGIHMLASSYGVSPDTTLQAQLTQGVQAVQQAMQIADTIKAQIGLANPAAK